MLIANETNKNRNEVDNLSAALCQRVNVSVEIQRPKIELENQHLRPLTKKKKIIVFAFELQAPSTKNNKMLNFLLGKTVIRYFTHFYYTQIS